MKENTVAEKDSLELISQMLKQTKDTLGVGSGNIFFITAIPHSSFH